ncbi:class I SAM-dependent DNA methyltransferase [Methylobacterium thuringiense]|uniref:Ubiquinone biosynthesis O-methyltransferase, mitochondrial n=1 Tax=Methylobacterium thuringiense TaxID=1003091 RepID=A0ABQ4TR62_9HYPH|nr:SAM-dependent methyltransferase [Methylobacterium thuringiense]GJE56854.1 Ubiquinone biosynthesis O-methyltransferase, mitochondrial [Methylobacterium thuringiense]
MTRHPTSLSPAYFAGLYADDPDPWRFATSDYERAKYAATLAALPRPRYASALEVGCSIGVLTRQLGSRCGALTAFDVVSSVLERARVACADQTQIRFLQAAVPGDWPDGRYDLILLSEIAYYLDRADLARLVACVETALLPGGDIVLVHYLGETDYPLSGDAAADGFIQGSAGFAEILAQSRTAEYRLDVLRRAVPEVAVA